ncbi:MAG: CoA-binding protein [Gammaproteobacteria bacterium]|nr:CoA-binding protein [Gammaproteobacteria bacterium]MBT8443553.1 CoA-binding protein [Gammaproteobacteria bacterium]NND36850.1 CoA-binding protein [Gammaproteobacteria bacterium]
MTDYPDGTLREILTSVGTIAVVGASDKEHRPVFRVMQFLQSKGYRCIPVNPRLAGRTLLGETVHAKLEDIPEPVDMVDVFRRAEDVPPIADGAIAIGARVLWMQLGIVNEAAAEHATAAGLRVIMDRCPAIEIPRLGL